ncbi:hypothetical protein [Amycolatopsis mediterranei]|uniref:hypothetical protein n=1 Tax=Amycolatopsis mediterranei TaxID=33910 RepID=UPI001E386DF7|nr:hypothetical protein [Amycolatopsis mediterranei]UZF71602.1 hypothetical protein ISP_004886 [Amycolatopsis mediterranei]
MVLTAALGGFLLVTVWARRPFLYEAARTVFDEDKQRTWQRNWDDHPSFRRRTCSTRPASTRWSAWPARPPRRRPPPGSGSTHCPGLVDTPALAPHRRALRDRGLRLADPDAVAAAVEAVLAGPGTGQVWAVQAGQLAAVVPATEVPLAAG